MGFDSLMAVELANQMGSSSGISLPVTLLFDYPNIEAMAGYILRDVLKLEFSEDQPRRGTQEPTKSPPSPR